MKLIKGNNTVLIIKVHHNNVIGERAKRASNSKM